MADLKQGSTMGGKEIATLENTNKTYVSPSDPSGTNVMKIGDMWFNTTTLAFNIWDGTGWGEISINRPRGTVDFVANDARLVVPVGTDKYASS